MKRDDLFITSVIAGFGILAVSAALELNAIKAEVKDVVVTADPAKVRGIMFQCNGVMDLRFEEGLWLVKCIEEKRNE